MIIIENPYIDENGIAHNNLVRRYSDAGFYLRQIETGTEYAEAVDVQPCRYTYEETDKLIEEAEDEINKL